MDLRYPSAEQNSRRISRCAITTHYTELLPEVRRLAIEYNIPLLGQSEPWEFTLLLTPERLELHCASHTKPMFVDFIKGAAGYRSQHSGRKQLLARAVGLLSGKTLKILDLTAGLGYDAFALAYLGCSVYCVERSPVVAALLQDGIRRAKQTHPALGMELIVGDSLHLTKDLVACLKPDAIYLDPMYPERLSTALPKKEMRWLRDLLGSDLDAAELLSSLLPGSCRRIAVKRPLHAGCLGNLQPSFTMRGRRCRYDIYL